jgi:hypothetical protein
VEKEDIFNSILDFWETCLVVLQLRKWNNRARQPSCDEHVRVHPLKWSQHMHTIDTHGGTLLYYAMQKMCMSIYTMLSNLLYTSCNLRCGQKFLDTWRLVIKLVYSERLSWCLLLTGAWLLVWYII